MRKPYSSCQILLRRSQFTVAVISTKGNVKTRLTRKEAVDDFLYDERNEDHGQELSVLLENRRSRDDISIQRQRFHFVQRFLVEEREDVFSEGLLGARLEVPC